MVSPEMGQQQRVRQQWLDCAERQRGTLAHALCLLAFQAIAEGRMLPLSEASAQLGRSAGEIRGEIEALAQRGRVTLDETGTAIAAAAGLSLLPSRHVLILNGRRLFTWCAFDAVGIPAGLGAEARVVSRCMGCGAPVGVTISGGRLVEASPASLTVALVPPDDRRLLRDGICAEMDFSCGCPSAAGDHRVRITVEEAMALGRDCWAAGCVPL